MKNENQFFVHQIRNIFLIEIFFFNVLSNSFNSSPYSNEIIVLFHIDYTLKSYFVIRDIFILFF